VPFHVYDGVFATGANVVIDGATFEVMDDAVFLEDCSGQIANTVFKAGDFDVYLMEGSTVGIYGSEWEKVKVEDSSKLLVEYLLTLTVKNQDGFGIAEAAVKIFDKSGNEWASGSTNSRGIFEAYLAHHAITADGDEECNEYTVNATKDGVSGSATIKMNNADTAASITLAMKNNSIFGMDPVVLGVIALVIVLVLVGALFFARKK
jgi:hypothetical protein